MACLTHILYSSPCSRSRMRRSPRYPGRHQQNTNAGASTSPCTQRLTAHSRRVSRANLRTGASTPSASPKFDFQPFCAAFQGAVGDESSQGHLEGPKVAPFRLRDTRLGMTGVGTGRGTGRSDNSHRSCGSHKKRQKTLWFARDAYSPFGRYLT